MFYVVWYSKRDKRHAHVTRYTDAFAAVLGFRSHKRGATLWRGYPYHQGSQELAQSGKHVSRSASVMRAMIGADRPIVAALDHLYPASA